VQSGSSSPVTASPELIQMLVKAMPFGVPVAASNALLDAALTARAANNISVIVIDVGDGHPSPSAFASRA
jgi:hypothetical protein